MKLRVWIPVLAVSVTGVGLARAQPPEAAAPETGERLDRSAVTAPRRALELTVGTGYAQGFGSLRSDVGMPSVATPGISIDGSVGYRVNPRFAVMVAGQYQDLDAQRSSSVRVFTATVAAQWHFRPSEKIDPWAEIGSGYRLLWEVPTPAPTELTHGFQLVRVRVGVDFRASPAVAVGPVIGADATVFLFQDAPGVPKNITDPTASTFIFAGIQGRFDVAGGAHAAAPTPSELEIISAR